VIRGGHLTAVTSAFAGLTMIEKRRASMRQLREEVVAFVVNDDESRKIDHLDLLDAILRQPRRRPPDRAEIEALVLLAGLAHFGPAIAFGEHHEAAAGGHELIDIG